MCIIIYLFVLYYVKFIHGQIVLTIMFYMLHTIYNEISIYRGNDTKFNEL